MHPRHRQQTEQCKRKAGKPHGLFNDSEQTQIISPDRQGAETQHHYKEHIPGGIQHETGEHDFQEPSAVYPAGKAGYNRLPQRHRVNPETSANVKTEREEQSD